MRKEKKGQMEIMGLAIVIILIAIGMLFVIRFIINREPAEFKAEFTQTQLASNTLNTYLKSNTKDCSGLSITELLQDCGQSQTIYCENGQLSCAYARDAAKYIFNQTLEEHNLKYYFIVYFKNERPTIELGKECVGDKKSRIYPIPTTTGRALYTQLDICG